MAVANRSWNRAYVIKKMKNRDFSGLWDVSSSIKFLYEDGAESFPTDPQAIYWKLQDYFEWFDSDCDLFVMAGSVVICALALSHLLQRYGEVCVAIYNGPKFQYEYYTIVGLPKAGVDLQKFTKGA